MIAIKRIIRSNNRIGDSKINRLFLKTGSRLEIWLTPSLLLLNSISFKLINEAFYI
jgi:hypothetical protein